MTSSDTTSTELPFQHLTIVGAGLIGGSLAMAAREAYPGLAIHVTDTDEATLQYVVRHGIANDVSRALPVSWEPNHLIVLAAHLKASQAALEKIAPVVKGQDVTVTDVGSCKRKISELGLKVLPDQFIPGHPMAGREFSGIQSATSLLFAGKSWLFCPYEETQVYERLKTFVTGLRAIPRSLDAAVHDRYMAYMSHLPQLYSILLTNLIDRHEPGHMLTYHGGGIDDQLRLAASPHAMWGEVFAENADNLRVVAREMGGMFGEMEALLDDPALSRWFDRSNRLHKDFQSLRQPGNARPTNQVL